MSASLLTVLAAGVSLVVAGAVEAQPQTASPSAQSAYAVPVEPLTLTGAKGGKFLEQGFSAGGYIFFGKMYSVGKSGLFSSKMKYNIRVDYRFLKDDQTPLVEGGCLITSETVSSLLGLIQTTTSGGLYACTVKDQPSSEFALEVAVPAVSEGGVSLGGISVSADKGGNKPYDQIKAKMLYKGVTYEAVPTHFDASRSISRIVDGYMITREGQPVGRVDFQGNNSTKGSITAPIVAGDGREAVIFMAAQLLAMPELNAGYIHNSLISGH